MKDITTQLFRQTVLTALKEGKIKTRGELAEKIGLKSKSWIGRLMNGGANVPYDTIEKTLVVLELPPDHLYHLFARNQMSAVGDGDVSGLLSEDMERYTTAPRLDKVEERLTGVEKELKVVKKGVNDLNKKL